MTLYTQTSRKYDYLNFAPNLLPNLLMVYVLDSSNELNPFTLIVYKFDGVKDHPVLVRPHGNSKRSNQPYRRTKQSTVSLLKAELEHNRPKGATNKVFAERGGIMMAKCAGDLPRDRTQTYNLKRKQQELKMM